MHAAYVWRGIRPLRLVRRRHVQELANGSAPINFASLPTEVYQIVEDQVIATLLENNDNKEPFEFPPLACCEDFFEDICRWPNYRLIRNHLSPEKRILFETFRDSKAFRMSDKAKDLRYLLLALHHQQDCQLPRREQVFWDLLSAGGPYDDARFGF